MKRSLLVLSCAVLFCPTGAFSAVFIADFDAPAYDAAIGQTVNGVVDPSSSTSWSVGTTNGTLGAGLQTYVQSDNGDNFLSIVDNTTSANVSARLNLGSAMPSTSAPFDISFTLAPSLSAGSATIFLGDNTLLFPAQVWLQLTLTAADQQIALSYKSTSGGTTNTFYLRNSNGTPFKFVSDQPFTFQATIDGTQFTSIFLNEVSQLGLGINPSTAYINATATPGSAFQMYINTAGTGSMDLFALSVVPEPGAASMVTLGGLFFFCYRLRRNRLGSR